MRPATACWCSSLIVDDSSNRFLSRTAVRAHRSLSCYPALADPIIHYSALRPGFVCGYEYYNIDIFLVSLGFYSPMYRGLKALIPTLRCLDIFYVIYVPGIVVAFGRNICFSK